jgi:hypothetical protein
MLNEINDDETSVTSPVRYLRRVSKRPFVRLTALSGVEGLKRDRNRHSGFDIGFMKTNEFKLRSVATSLFDVRRWTFDVGRSFFKTTPYGVNSDFKGE